MMKTTAIHAALLGSASALGVNWVYDRPLLKKYLQDKNPIFLPIDHDLYSEAKTSFDVYPNHKIGDLDFMAEILYQTHIYRKQSLKQDLAGYKKHIYSFIGPSGSYDGYIESYAKDFIEQYNKAPELHTSYIDKQLIGPAMTFCFYDQPDSINQIADSLNFAKVFTAYSGVNDFTLLTHTLLTDFKHKVNKHIALKGNIKLAPKSYQEALKAALTDIPLEEFIEQYSGVGCGLEQTYPLIYYIVDKSRNWEEALQLNAEIGGASSGRGIFISAFFNFLTGIPDQYFNMLQYKL